MNLFGMLDVSGSALKAERVRAEVVASNMANLRNDTDGRWNTLSTASCHLFGRR